MSNEITVKGLKELQAALDTLAPKIEANIMRGAMRAGVKVMQKEAQVLAPVGPPSFSNAAHYGGRPGLLRDSIKLKTSLKNGVAMGRVVAGGKVKGGGDAYYAYMVEKTGAKPHRIKGRKGGRLSFGGGSYWGVDHPGFKAHPFMVPAFDTSGQAAISASADYIRTRLSDKHGINVPAPMEEGDE